MHGQIVPRRLGPMLSERQVVLDRPALVTMPLNQHVRRGMGLEPLDVAIQNGRRFASNFRVVEIKMDVPKSGLLSERPR